MTIEETLARAYAFLQEADPEPYEITSRGAGDSAERSRRISQAAERNRIRSRQATKWDKKAHKAVAKAEKIVHKSGEFGHPRTWTTETLAAFKKRRMEVAQKLANK